MYILSMSVALVKNLQNSKLTSEMLRSLLDFEIFFLCSACFLLLFLNIGPWKKQTIY